MKIILHYAGKSRRGDWVSEGAEHYHKRIRVFTPFELRAHKVSSQEQWTKRVLSALEPRQLLYLLDERGAPWSSPTWASKMEEAMLEGRTALHLAIGGAEGHSEELRRAAQGMIQLSPAVMAHEIARLVTLEQIYRAWTLLRGHPYHRG